MEESIKLKQYNGEDIDILSLLNEGEKKQFNDYYVRGPTYSTACFHYLGERHDRIGKFIGNNRGLLIDCGFHLGLFSMIFNKCFDKIIGFEPFPYHFNLGKMLTKSFYNIQMIPYAIGIETKELPLYIDAVNETQTSLLVHKDCRQYTNVTCIKLEDFCLLNHINKIDFLKIDIEGGELNLITNSSFDNISKLISKIHCECHNIDAINDQKSYHWEEVRFLVNEKLNKLGFSTEIHNDEIFAKK